MRLPRGISLRYRIAAGVILGLAVLLTAFGYLAVRAIGQTRDVALEERLRLAETTAGSVDALVQHTARQLEAVAALAVSRGEGCASREMPALLHVLGTFDAISCLDPQGQVVWTEPLGRPPVTDGVAGDARFAEALQSGDTLIMQASAQERSHPPIALVVAPLRQPSGERLGSLAGELHVSHVGLPLVSLPEQAGSVNAELVDARGYILARGDGDNAMKADEHAPILQEFITEGRAGTKIHEDHVIAYYPLESLPGGVVIEQREDQALAVPRDLQRTALIFGIGAVLVASVAAWFHARGVVKPIGDLTRASSKIAAGALDDPIRVSRDDEVGALARSFEAMRVRLKESREQQERWEKELEERVRLRTEELERRNREQAALNRIAETVSRSLDAETIMTASLEEVLEIMGAHAGGLFLTDGSLGGLSRGVDRGLPSSGERGCGGPLASSCLCGQAVSRGEAVLVEDASTYWGWTTTTCRVRGFGSLAVVPLRAKDQSLGVLVVADREPRRISRRDIDLLTAIGNTVGVSVENALLHQEIQEKEAIRGQLLEQAISAQEDERKRIARELHDESAQVLATLLVQISAAEGLLPSEEGRARAILERAKDDAGRALTEMRQLILDLRPSALDDLGLVAAIRWYAKTRVEQAGVQARVRVGGRERRLPAAVETALFRIVQEAMNNVVKHAQAKSVDVRLEFAADSVSLAVQDDGRGFDMKSSRQEEADSGLGLVGMRERAVLLGGKASIVSQPGRGTRVAVEIPLGGPDG